MKHLYFLILFISISFISAAQTNFRFADSTAQWNVLETWYGWTGISYSTSIHSVQKDTLVNNVRYQLIDSNMLIRKDSLGRVYRLYTTEACENIIYDFSANQGDTLVFYPKYNCQPTYPDSFSCIVDSVYSIVIGYTRKAMKVTYSTEQNIWGYDIWVDGIGSMSDYVLHPASNVGVFDGPSGSLLCYFENNNILYHNTAFNTCVYDTTIYLGINDISTQHVQLFPNPVTQNQFTLTLSETPKPNTSFMLYDEVGRLVRCEELNSINQTIYTNGLANGIYTYVIDANKVKSGSGKLVVTK